MQLSACTIKNIYNSKYNRKRKTINIEIYKKEKRETKVIYSTKRNIFIVIETNQRKEGSHITGMVAPVLLCSYKLLPKITAKRFGLPEVSLLSDTVNEREQITSLN